MPAPTTPATPARSPRRFNSPCTSRVSTLTAPSSALRLGPACHVLDVGTVREDTRAVFASYQSGCAWTPAAGLLVVGLSHWTDDVGQDKQNSQLDVPIRSIL